MTPIHRSFLMLAALTTAACADATSTTSSLLDEKQVTADIAASSGEAIAASIESMLGNEAAGSLSYVSGEPDATANAMTVNRTRTCFDANGAVVANCSPISSVRKIATHVTIDGDRTGTHNTEGGATVTWTGAVHRVLHDTVTRNFNGSTETSRTHTAVGTGNDTTTFTDGTVTRKANEAAVDSVRAVTWNLPRSNNPWPVSGSIVRRASGNIAITKGDRSESRSFSRRVQVTFPADAQGNVVLQINDKTCNLNLVTRRVTNCQ